MFYIETFFKVCKSYLALAKEFQGRSFDMQVATTTIVFLRYAMLALESRKANDDRTIGDLFYYLREEMADIQFSQSLMLLVDTLRHVLNAAKAEPLVVAVIRHFGNKSVHYHLLRHRSAPWSGHVRQGRPRCRAG